MFNGHFIANLLLNVSVLTDGWTDLLYS